jgi:hypothetical protein
MPIYEVEIIHEQSGKAILVQHESDVPADLWEDDESLFTEVLNDISIVPIRLLED